MAIQFSSPVEACLFVLWEVNQIKARIATDMADPDATMDTISAGAGILLAMEESRIVLRLQLLIQDNGEDLLAKLKLILGELSLIIGNNENEFLLTLQEQINTAEYSYNSFPDNIKKAVETLQTNTIGLDDKKRDEQAQKWKNLLKQCYKNLWENNAAFSPYLLREVLNAEASANEDFNASESSSSFSSVRPEVLDDLQHDDTDAEKVEALSSISAAPNSVVPSPQDKPQLHLLSGGVMDTSNPQAIKRYVENQQLVLTGIEQAHSNRRPLIKVTRVLLTAIAKELDKPEVTLEKAQAYHKISERTMNVVRDPKIENVTELYNLTKDCEIRRVTSRRVMAALCVVVGVGLLTVSALTFVGTIGLSTPVSGGSAIVGAGLLLTGVGLFASSRSKGLGGYANNVASKAEKLQTTDYIIPSAM